MKVSLLKTLPVMILVGLAYALPVQAGDISVSPLIVDMAPGTPFQDITVGNVGKDKAYVKVSIAKLTNPGNGKETFQNDSGNPAVFGIAITPQKFALPTGQNRAIRVINFNKDLAQDAVYIATISPVSSLVESTANVDGQDVNLGMQISVAYKVKIFVRPANPHAELTVNRDGKTATITNTGNTNVLLTGFSQCTDEESDCQDLQLINRLYAGNSWTVTLPTDAPFQFTEQYLNTTQQIKSK